MSRLEIVATNIHIVTAIANYTVRVAETSLSATQRQEALKFLGMLYLNLLCVCTY